METANKQLAAKECEGTEDNRKTISQLLAQSEWTSTSGGNLQPPRSQLFWNTIDVYCMYEHWVRDKNNSFCLTY